MQRPRMAIVAVACLLVLCWTGSVLQAQELNLEDQVIEHTLDNGMKILMVERHEVPRVVCHIYYRVGSVNERPGITGISHFHEHMMFKGTRTIGVMPRPRQILTAAPRSARVLGPCSMSTQMKSKGAAQSCSTMGWEGMRLIGPITGPRAMSSFRLGGNWGMVINSMGCWNALGRPSP